MLSKIWDFIVVSFAALVGVAFVCVIVFILIVHEEQSREIIEERENLKARIEEGTTTAKQAKEIILEYTGNEYVYDVKDVEAKDELLKINAIPKCYYNYSKTRRDVVIVHIPIDASDEDILKAKEIIRQKAIEVQQERLKKLENLKLQTNLTE